MLHLSSLQQKMTVSYFIANLWFVRYQKRRNPIVYVTNNRKAIKMIEVTKAAVGYHSPSTKSLLIYQFCSLKIETYVTISQCVGCIDEHGQVKHQQETNECVVLEISINTAEILLVATRPAEFDDQHKNN